MGEEAVVFILLKLSKAASDAVNALNDVWAN